MGMYEGPSKPLVLIVDDEPECAWPLAQLLSEDAYGVVALDWQQALVKLAAHTIDMILLDIGMPQLDGFMISERLKKDPRTADIPVIFVTGSTQERDEARGFAVGAVDYIHKPFLPAVILARVRTHLHQRQLTKSLRQRASTDGLTGLANRAAIDEGLEIACRRRRDNSESMCLLLIDLDHFKQCNDTHGHQAGDRVLQQVAQCLLRCVRAGDSSSTVPEENWLVLS